MILTKTHKTRIFKALDKKYSFNVFGFYNINLLRSDAKLPNKLTDKAIKKYTDSLLD